VPLLSRILAWLCVFAAVGMAAIGLLFSRTLWFNPDLEQWAHLALLAAWIISTGFLIWGLYNGRTSFTGLARGELFARRTIAGLRNLALGIFVFKIGAFVLAVGMALGSRGPPNFIISFKDLAEGLFTLISLGAIVLIASVLTRAAEIAEDNAQIV